MHGSLEILVEVVNVGVRGHEVTGGLTIGTHKSMRRAGHGIFHEGEQLDDVPVDANEVYRAGVALRHLRETPFGVQSNGADRRCQGAQPSRCGSGVTPLGDARRLIIREGTLSHETTVPPGASAQVQVWGELAVPH